uniref:Chemokine ligand 34b n=1 Tax=Ctenopharyngodon idella TaxID=7959 RepID=A0A345D711_CTEID|nr:chemokine ligand 34b [Ctenopharyngodon idella]
METQRILMRSLAVVFISSVIWTITALPVQKVNTCCTEVSTVELTDPIIGFRLQKQSSPCVKAVIFQTERGEFCFNWTQPWVQKKVRQFLFYTVNDKYCSDPKVHWVQQTGLKKIED